tara:strand:+ start:183 stop:581 length:399 start_codon:yes stop_codon:yes gene_type:complete
MVEKNKNIVRQAYAAISRGDVDGFMSRLTEDVEWYFIGSHLFSGTMKGKEEIMAKLFSSLGNKLEPPGIQLEIRQLIGETDKIVAEMQGTATSTDGIPYNNSYTLILTLRDGLICSIREYLDTELVTSVFGK